MIASRKPVHRSPVAAWQQQFLSLLPKIERQAHFHFRHLHGQNHEDAVREIIANAFCGFRRLAELNRLNQAYASALVHFAVAGFVKCLEAALNDADLQKVMVAWDRSPNEIRMAIRALLRVDETRTNDCI